MVLYKLEDFDENYQHSFGSDDIKGYDVYSTVDDEKVGTVKNILVDEAGHFRYFVVDTGFWIFGKHILLPVGRSRTDASDRRIYAVGLTKEQVRDLPEFGEDLRIDRDYEERVTGVYSDRPAGGTATQMGTSAASMPYIGSEMATPPMAGTSTTGSVDNDVYDYQQKPDLFGMNEQDHQTLRLYEERLVANKQRRKTGEVEIGKHIETETQRVAVPVEKERVVIERVTPTDAGKAVTPEATAFREGEVAHMDIYEEQADIHKETVLREEVRVRKEVERDTVETQETIRREELEIDSDGRPIVDNNL